MAHLIEKPQETMEHLSASYSAIQETERLLWIEWSGFQGRRQAGENLFFTKEHQLIDLQVGGFSEMTLKLGLPGSRSSTCRTPGARRAVASMSD